MKTQHIKFEILEERLRLFYCNFTQHNVVLNMFSIGQICKENFHPFCDVMDDVTKSLVDGVSQSVFRCTSTPMETDPIDACVQT